MVDKDIRTRIAPSPTGNLHVGTARAALFNELFARQQGGNFIVRIEDTDAERSKPEFEENILEGLKWLGLKWDEGPDMEGDFGPYRQSERKDLHIAAIAKLLESGMAYQNEGEEAVYLKVVDEEVSFVDIIRGEVKVATDTWGGDFVIARNLESPIFHLAVVADDAAQEISHVIRGEDHISNTGRHILLQRALKVKTPEYAHLPLLLDDQRRKLSKRAGETDLLSYRDGGYLPEAMLNYLALLGWNPKTDEEMFSHKELIEKFKLENVQKGGAIFSMEKLESVNKGHIKELTDKDLLDKAHPFLGDNYKKLDDNYLIAALNTEKERVSNLKGLSEAIEFFLPEWPGDYEIDLLIWRKSDGKTTVDLLSRLLEKVTALNEGDFTEESLQEDLMMWIDKEELGRGDVLWPMRVALTGREHSPGPFEVAGVLGKEETVKRLEKAHDKLAKSV